MDAKITKSRLSNLLSYDWLKIILAAVVAVLALSVFFTTIKTRAQDTQVFTIYGYSDLSVGSDVYELEDDLMDNDVFSYEILTTSLESLADSTGLYSGAMYTTRLVNTARTVMFLHSVDDEESDGYSALATLFDANEGSDDYELHGFLDFEVYLSDCREYLVKFFGEDLENGALDEEKAEECFLARNSNDKRYRTDEKKAAGIEEEKDRLNKLRDDYLALIQAFEDGVYEYSYVTISEEYAEENYVTAGTYNCGVSVGKLSKFTSVFYYTVEKEDGTTVNTVSDMTMILFNTGVLGDKTNDLRYETVSFLVYLMNAYGT